jgi:hypothetical protein
MTKGGVRAERLKTKDKRLKKSRGELRIKKLRIKRGRTKAGTAGCALRRAGRSKRELEGQRKLNS